MQINHYPQIYKKWGEWILKTVATTLCLYFVATHVSWEQVRLTGTQLDIRFILTVLLVVGLMLTNWGLEAEKWRISLPRESITFPEALNAVLAGLALNWVVPFTLGDASGRLASLADKQHSAIALLVNRTLMISITTLYGGISVLFYFGHLTGATFSGLLLIFASLGYFVFRPLSSRFFFGDLSLIVKILFLSLIRYVIFTWQFYLIIQLFVPQLSVSLTFLGIGWIFLFRSFVPSLFGNFGVREASALLFFQPYLADVQVILAPCIFIWVINTVVPSLYGAFCVLKLRVNIVQ